MNQPLETAIVLLALAAACLFLLRRYWLARRAARSGAAVCGKGSCGCPTSNSRPLPPQLRRQGH